MQQPIIITPKLRRDFMLFMQQEYPDSLYDYLNQGGELEPGDYPFQKPPISIHTHEITIYELRSSLFPDEQRNTFYVRYTSDFQERMKQHKASAIKTQQSIEEIYAELTRTSDSKRARGKIIGASGDTGFSVTKWESVHLKPYKSPRDVIAAINYHRAYEYYLLTQW
jgi:hypothetical protein